MSKVHRAKMYLYCKGDTVGETISNLQSAMKKLSQEKAERIARKIHKIGKAKK